MLHHLLILPRLLHFPLQHLGAACIHGGQGQESVQGFHHGYPCAQVGQNAGKLAADDAAAHDDHGFRNPVEVEGAGARNHGAFWSSERR